VEVGRGVRKAGAGAASGDVVGGGGGGAGAVATEAEGAAVGPGVDAMGLGSGFGAGFGAASVRSGLRVSGAIAGDGSFFGESLAHPARAIDAAAVRATAMPPDVETAARAQNGHAVSDA